VDLFALATVAQRPDEAIGPPPTNIYTLRDNLEQLGDFVVGLYGKAAESKHGVAVVWGVAARGYHEHWLLERQGYRTPTEARAHLAALAQATVA